MEKTIDTGPTVKTTKKKAANCIAAFRVVLELI